MHLALVSQEQAEPRATAAIRESLGLLVQMVLMGRQVSQASAVRMVYREPQADREQAVSQVYRASLAFRVELGRLEQAAIADRLAPAASAELQVDQVHQGSADIQVNLVRLA